MLPDMLTLSKVMCTDKKTQNYSLLATMPKMVMVLVKTTSA